MDGPMVQSQRRSVVASVGLSRPPGRADGVAGVRAAAVKANGSNHHDRGIE